MNQLPHLDIEDFTSCYVSHDIHIDYDRDQPNVEIIHGDHFLHLDQPCTLVILDKHYGTVNEYLREMMLQKNIDESVDDGYCMAGDFYSIATVIYERFKQNPSILETFLGYKSETIFRYPEDLPIGLIFGQIKYHLN